MSRIYIRRTAVPGPITAFQATVVTGIGQILSPTVSTGNAPQFRGAPATSTGETNTGLPTGIQTGDTVLGIFVTDPNQAGDTPASYAIPAGATWVQQGGGTNAHLNVWTMTYGSEADFNHDKGVSPGVTYEKAVYAIHGPHGTITAGTLTSSTGTTPTWSAVTTTANDIVVALSSTYNPASLPYTKADGSYSTDVSQVSWVGLGAMSFEGTGAGSESPDPAGSFASSGNMTTLLVRVPVS